MEDSYIALWWKSVLTSSLLRLYTYLILIKEFNNMALVLHFSTCDFASFKYMHIWLKEFSFSLEFI